MKKNKVFLSTSKAGSYQDGMKCKNYVKHLGMELVEFDGGGYCPEPMLECDYLVILTPNFAECLLGVFEVGKGQYEQIESWFREHNNSYDGIFIVSSLQGGLYVDEVGNHIKTDHNWKDNYGFIHTNDQIIEIVNYTGKPDDIYYGEIEGDNLGYDPITFKKIEKEIKDICSGKPVPMLATRILHKKKKI